LPRGGLCLPASSRETRSATKASRGCVRKNIAKFGRSIQDGFDFSHILSASRASILRRRLQQQPKSNARSLDGLPSICLFLMFSDRPPVRTATLQLVQPGVCPRSQSRCENNVADVDTLVVMNYLIHLDRRPACGMVSVLTSRLISDHAHHDHVGALAKISASRHLGWTAVSAAQFSLRTIRNRS
jgi:hypothetical protein